MANPLIDKIRRARESQVEAGGYTFTIRRPTDLEMAQLSGREALQVDLVRDFVIGWGGVKESDLIPGGSPVDVAFDGDLFREWVVDHPELWAPISAAVMAAYSKWRSDQGDIAKN